MPGRAALGWLVDPRALPRPFDGKDQRLALAAPAVATECAGRADDAVAWNQERDRVGAHGRAYPARRGWRSDGAGDRLIGNHLTLRNGQERLPHLDLKGRAF